jgi:hypothetical protein
MRWVGYVVCTGKERNAHSILDGNLEVRYQQTKLDGYTVIMFNWTVKR